MTKKQQALYTLKHAQTTGEEGIIAREIALLRTLEGKLSTRIPAIDLWTPNKYLYSYPEIPGEILNTGLYWDLSENQKSKLAQDLAVFAFELHTILPVIFAQAIGFTNTDWPLSPEILEKYVPQYFDDPLYADGKMQRFFAHFLEEYRPILEKPQRPVFLHNDLHGKNILVHCHTGRLKGIIDFEDAAIGDPFLEFRLLYEIDAQLMEEAAYLYARMARIKFNVQRVHVYYLATQYSRLVEIAQGKSEYKPTSIIVELMLYEEKYGRIPKSY